MLDVVGAHPLARGQGGEGRVQAVHMEQQGAIVTLDQRGHPAAPGKQGIHNVWMVGPESHRRDVVVLLFCIIKITHFFNQLHHIS